MTLEALQLLSGRPHRCKCACRRALTTHALAFSLVALEAFKYQRAAAQLQGALADVRSRTRALATACRLIVLEALKLVSRQPHSCRVRLQMCARGLMHLAFSLTVLEALKLVSGQPHSCRVRLHAVTVTLRLCSTCVTAGELDTCSSSSVDSLSLPPHLA